MVVLETTVARRGGSNPSVGTNLCWPVAQLVERVTVNHVVVGSTPTGSAILWTDSSAR